MYLTGRPAVIIGTATVLVAAYCAVIVSDYQQLSYGVLLLLTGGGLMASLAIQPIMPAVSTAVPRVSDTFRATFAFALVVLGSLAAWQSPLSGHSALLGYSAFPLLAIALVTLADYRPAEHLRSKLALLLVGFLATHGIGSAFSLSDPLADVLAYDRPSGLFPDVNVFAAVLCVGLLVALDRLRYAPPQNRVWAYAIIAVTVIAIFLTQSRGAVAALAATLLLTFALRNFSGYRRFVALTAGIVLCGMVLWWALYLRSHSIEIRAHLVNATIAMYLDGDIIFGNGTGSWAPAYAQVMGLRDTESSGMQAHSDWLHFLYEAGPLSAIVLLAWLLWSLRNVARLPAGSYGLLCAQITVHLLLFALVNFGLTMPSILALLALAHVGQREPRPPLAAGIARKAHYLLGGVLLAIGAYVLVCGALIRVAFSLEPVTASTRVEAAVTTLGQYLPSPYVAMSVARYYERKATFASITEGSVSGGALQSATAAIEWYTRAGQLEPTRPDFLTARAQFLTSPTTPKIPSNAEMAQSAYENAYRLSPFRLKTVGPYARFLARQDSVLKACDVLTRALQKNGLYTERPQLLEIRQSLACN